MRKNTTLASVMLGMEEEKEYGIYFVYPEEEDIFVSYGQLLKEAKQVVAYLNSKGIKKGDKLIFQISDNHNFLKVFWGCIIGGIIAVPIAADINLENLSRLYNVISVIGEASIITEREKAVAITEGLDREKLVISSISNPFIYVEEASGFELVSSLPEAQEEDIAIIQFSSGSTGMPKGIILSQRNLVFSLEKMSKRLRLQQSDVDVYWLPLTYDMGLIGCHLLCVYSNSTQVEIATSDFMKDPYIWVKAISDYRATYTITSGSSLEIARQSLCEENKVSLDYSTLRMVIIGGEMIKAKECRDYLKAFRRYGLVENVLFPAYGLAETTLGVALPDPNEEFSPLIVDTTSFVVGTKIHYCENMDGNNILELVDSGYAIEDCEIRICNYEGKVLGEDIFGIIEVRGDCVYQGYYNKDTDSSITDGWYRTRDHGFLHNNRLVVTGRMDDVIIINGQNYFITDLVHVIQNAKTIQGREMTICKKLDQNTNEDGFAVFIQYDKGLDAFIDVVKEIRELFFKYAFLKAKYIIPISEIPKTGSGKIRNSVLEKKISTGEYNGILSTIEEKLLEHSKKTKVKSDISKSKNEVLELLIEIWEDINGVCIDPDESFFSFGMDSLMLSRFVDKISERIGTTLNVSDLFYCTTMKDIADLISAK